MTVALLTTLYGAMIANLIALPIADKLASCCCARQAGAGGERFDRTSTGRKPR